MNIYVIAHFILAVMCLTSYLCYGVFDKSEITLFQTAIVIGIALTPVLNVVFTLWCIIYLIHSLLGDLKGSISEVNKKAFGT